MADGLEFAAAVDFAFVAGDAVNSLVADDWANSFGAAVVDAVAAAVAGDVDSLTDVGAIEIVVLGLNVVDS